MEHVDTVTKGSQMDIHHTFGYHDPSCIKEKLKCIKVVSNKDPFTLDKRISKLFTRNMKSDDFNTNNQP